MNQTFQNRLFSFLAFWPIALMAQAHAGRPDKAACLRAIENPNTPRGRVVKVGRDFSNLSPLEAFLAKKSLDVARHIVVKEAAQLEGYFRVVLSSRWKEEYGLVPSEEMCQQDKAKYIALKCEETRIRKILYKAIKEEDSLLSIDLNYHGSSPVGEKYFDNEDEHRQWQADSIGDELGPPLMALSFGDLAQGKDAEAWRIYITDPDITVEVPVFHKGRYVCDLMFIFCRLAG